jgi:histidine kinase/tetratricopeptide repeat protein
MEFKWLIIFFSIPLHSLSQHQRIDSLAKSLPSLKDSARIDCLNGLSLEYYINALSETYINVHTDTASSYAMQAFQEASKIHYKYGIASALQNLGEIARDRGDYSTAEAHFHESVTLFQSIHALERSSWANLTLGWTLHKQCKYSEAKLAYEHGMQYSIISKNLERKSMFLRLISYTYGERGYNVKAFDYMLQAIQITNKINDARGVISSPENMGNLYKSAGDTSVALSFLRLAAAAARTNNPVRYNHTMGSISALFDHLDSAVYYYKECNRLVDSITNDRLLVKRATYFRSIYIGEVYIRQSKYDLAIRILRDPLLFFEKGNDKICVMRILTVLGKCYQARGSFAISLSYARRLFKLAENTGSRPYIRDSYELYWKNFDKMNQTDSAYKYSLRYIALKDSIMSDEYRRNVALSQMRSQDEQQKSRIALLQKDQQLIQEKLYLQQQTIKSEMMTTNVVYAATGALILIVIFIFRAVHLKRKNEKQQLEHALALQQLESKKATIEFQQQATELEMQALRAQMNPHFIFNCLSSINRFILINKTEEASDYLTKFSRLIRMALYNSEKSVITLEHELEALRLYLDLERLRFKNAFNYSITFVNTIDVNTVFIPPMLVQPFTENAIWHGLMHKKGIGHLDIQLCADEKVLTCVIVDDGIGRNMASSLNSRSAEKQKSMGVNITAGRLALLNKSREEAVVCRIEDLMDEEGNGCGTKVVLRIPYKELTEVVL